MPPWRSARLAAWNRHPVVTYGVNDMVLDNWGVVDSWTAEQKITSYGPSAAEPEVDARADFPIGMLIVTGVRLVRTCKPALESV